MESQLWVSDVEVTVPLATGKGIKDGQRMDIKWNVGRECTDIDVAATPTYIRSVDKYYNRICLVIESGLVRKRTDVQ